MNTGCYSGAGVCSTGNRLRDFWVTWCFLWIVRLHEDHLWRSRLHEVSHLFLEVGPWLCPDVGMLMPGGSITLTLPSILFLLSQSVQSPCHQSLSPRWPASSLLGSGQHPSHLATSLLCSYSSSSVVVVSLPGLFSARPCSRTRQHPDCEHLVSWPVGWHRTSQFPAWHLLQSSRHLLLVPSLADTWPPPGSVPAEVQQSPVPA